MNKDWRLFKTVKFDKHKKKTLSNNWNNFSIKPKSNPLHSGLLKKIFKKINEFFGFRLSIKIVRTKKYESDEFRSFQTHKDIINFRNKKISNIIVNFFLHFKIHATKIEIINYINEFEKIFFESPVKDLSSGYGFNEGLILFCILSFLTKSFKLCLFLIS